MTKIGALVGGEFVFEAALGTGGAAQVWRVRHCEEGTVRALKILTSTQPEAQARLLREGRVQRQLRHPNIVPAHDLIEIDGRPALLLELIRGPSLAAVLREQPLLSEAQIDAVALGLFAGVQAVHALGVVHRDLKPANVLLEPKNGIFVPRIGDFGLARLGPAEGGQALTATDAAMGTPQYMAPEQIRDTRSVDARADLWALGCILYELVCGQRAYSDGDMAVLFEKIIHGDRPPLPANVPARWAQAIGAALVPDPDARVACCGDLAALWGAPAETAPLSLSHTPLAEIPAYSLPYEVDAFVGRVDELAALQQGLWAGRLVSLIGRGGTGKTRLAARLGWAVLREFSGGVWFCELSEAREPIDVCLAVAAALKVPLQGRDPAAQLGAAIRGRRRCLIILDNAEQILGPVRALLEQWLGAAADARFLVTSREALSVPDEQTVLLDGLPFDTDAVALFAARATGRRARFSLEHNSDTVLEIVSALSGLPLAIELAAARVALMSLEKLRDRLQDRFRLLARRGSRSRHATLRATIDWSWDLLDAAEQRALATLAVFSGGATLEAASAVLGGAGAARLDSLVSKSLVRSLAHGRFGLFPSIQAYAAERLVEVEPDQGAQRRHAAHFAQHGADAALARLHTFGGVARYEVFKREYANLTAATERAIGWGAAEQAALLCRAGHAIALRRGPIGVGRAFAVRILALPGVSDAARAHAAAVAAEECGLTGRNAEAVAHLGLALRAAEAVSDTQVAVYALRRMAVIAQARGQADECLGFIERAAATADGDPVLETSVLQSRAVYMFAFRNRAEATQLYRQVLQQTRAHGNRLRECTILTGLGTMEEGTTAEERSTFLRTALSFAEKLGDRVKEGVCLNNLGLLQLGQYQIDEAIQTFQAALRIAEEVGSRYSMRNRMCNLANAFQTRGQLAEAEALYRSCIAISVETGERRMVGQLHYDLADMLMRQGRTDEASDLLDRADAIAREIDSTGTLGRIQVGRHYISVQRGRLDEARAHLEQAAALYASIGASKLCGYVANCQGWLALDQGHTEDAQRHCAAFVATLDANPSVGDEVMRCALQARVFLATGRPDDAAASMAHAEAISADPRITLGPEEREYLARARAVLNR